MAISKKFKISCDFWIEIEKLIPGVQRSAGSGRRAVAARDAFDGILYVLREGCNWAEMPSVKGSGAKAVHNYYRSWLKAGLFMDIFTSGLAKHDDMRGIAWTWDASLNGGSWRPKANSRNRDVC